VNHDPVERLPRQQLEREFVETGAVYAIGVQRFLVTGRRFPGRVVLHEVPAARSLEIDDSADLDLARHLAGSMPLPDGSSGSLPANPAAVVFDFDGVLTDDRVLTLQDGTEGVLCSRGDGLGVEHLRHAGVRMLVLSKECNPVVAARAAKLRLECVHGDDDKAATVVRWCHAGQVDLSRVVYVGNDVNDLGAFQVVGFPVAVADAHPSVRAAARVVLDAPGGRGAARELSERILYRKGAPR
jgi:N-acylneuraminate cytidylyltransferase